MRVIRDINQLVIFRPMGEMEKGVVGEEMRRRSVNEISLARRRSGVDR